MGSGLLWPHNWGGGSGSSSSNEVPEVPLGTGTPGTSPRGPGAWGAHLQAPGGSRPRRSLCGPWEAWQPSPPSRRAAHITSLDPQFLCSGGWQKIYCTSDLGTWWGLVGAGGRAGGTCLGDRARVSLSYGPSAGTSVFPEGLSAGPGQPPGVSVGLGVSSRVCAGHLCKLVHAWTGPDVAARACLRSPILCCCSSDPSDQRGLGGLLHMRTISKS